MKCEDFWIKKRTNSKSILFGLFALLNMVLHFTIQPTKIHGGKVRSFIVVVWDGLGAPLRIDTTGWISGPKHSNNIKISVHRQHSRRYLYVCAQCEEKISIWKSKCTKKSCLDFFRCKSSAAKPCLRLFWLGKRKHIASCMWLGFSAPILHLNNAALSHVRLKVYFEYLFMPLKYVERDFSIDAHYIRLYFWQ